MSRKGKKREPQDLYGAHPVDSVAARVMGKPKKEIPDPKKLRKKAQRAKSPERRQMFLDEADRAEKALERSAKAKQAAKKRMTGPKAVERAKKALEAAKWRRENEGK